MIDFVGLEARGYGSRLEALQGDAALHEQVGLEIWGPRADRGKYLCVDVSDRVIIWRLSLNIMAGTKRGGRLEGKVAIITGAAG